MKSITLDTLMLDKTGLKVVEMQSRLLHKLLQQFNNLAKRTQMNFRFSIDIVPSRNNQLITCCPGQLINAQVAAQRKMRSHKKRWMKNQEILKRTLETLKILRMMTLRTQTH